MIFSLIDTLVASKMTSANFVTIEFISDWLTFVFKLNGFWVSSYSIFSEKRF